VRPGTQPINLVWWLVSRASGIVALALISLSVLIGLTMAAKVVRRPGLKRSMVKLHEHIALAAILAIGAHGLSLLGDHWLKPGWNGIAVPFALSYRPLFTGLGIIGGYLVVLLGPSFYLRRRIGARRWRRLHTLIVLAWVLSAVHTLGAGSDARKLWLEAVVVGPVLPIVYVFVLRLLRPRRAVRAASGRSLDRAPHQLDRVVDRQRLAELPQMGVQLGGASGVGRRDGLGAGLEEVAGLAGAEL
jgi:sulfoxide reductase heme-binding subunit YedZ